MSKFYQDPEFRKLQRQWYGKLREEGFTDIETIGPDGEAMDKMGSGAGCYASTLDTLRKYKPDQERYFELARAHYWEIPLHRGREYRDAFRLYAEGSSISAVSRQMGWSPEKVRKMVNAEEDKFLPKRSEP